MQDTAEYLSKLQRLAMIPDKPVGGDFQIWERVQEDLNIIVPRDVIDFIEVFWNGRFGDFGLCSPFAAPVYLQLSRNGLIFNHRALAPLAQEISIPILPDPEGYLAIGHTANRMSLLMRSTNEKDYTLLWFDQQYPFAYTIDTGIAQFLYELYSDDISEDWARSARGLIWSPDESLFIQRP